MHAFGIRAYGQAPELLDLPVPEPGPGEVRLRIAACGLNFADLLMIDGKYQERPEPPLTLGMEPAGWIDALGPDTDGPAVGDPRRGLWQRGRAGRIRLLFRQALPADPGRDAFRSCRGLPDRLWHQPRRPQPQGTAPAGRDTARPRCRGRRRADGGGDRQAHGRAGHRLRPRDRQARRGAGGGGRSPDRQRRRRTSGPRSRRSAAPMWSTIRSAASSSTRRFRATNPEGRIVVIGFASGKVPQIAANHLLVKNISVIGLYWGGYLAFRPEVLTGSLETLLGWYAEGGLRPHVRTTCRSPAQARRWSYCAAASRPARSWSPSEARSPEITLRQHCASP